MTEAEPEVLRQQASPCNLQESPVRGAFLCVRFAEASLLAAMSKQERKEHARTNGQVLAGDAGERTKRSRTPLTAEALTKNMLQFRDALKK